MGWRWIIKNISGANSTRVPSSQLDLVGWKSIKTYNGGICCGSYVRTRKVTVRSCLWGPDHEWKWQNSIKMLWQQTTHAWVAGGLASKAEHWVRRLRSPGCWIFAWFWFYLLFKSERNLNLQTLNIHQARPPTKQPPWPWLSYTITWVSPWTPTLRTCRSKTSGSGTLRRRNSVCVTSRMMSNHAALGMWALWVGERRNHEVIGLVGDNTSHRCIFENPFVFPHHPVVLQVGYAQITVLVDPKQKWDIWLLNSYA